MTRKKRTQRLRRVDETLRQIISESLLQNRDRHLEGIVVTGVETSSDTAFADVYVQVPGNDASASTAWPRSSACGRRSSTRSTTRCTCA